MSAKALEVIRAISQAAANSYDGAHLENYSYDGDAKAIGLKREEGDPILDHRVMDGFGIKFGGNKLIITYHSEVFLKEVYSGKFENEVNRMIEKVASFLKKEYKVLTGETLSLKADGEVDAIVQNTSRVRTWVQASKPYIIGNLSEVQPVLEDADRDIDKDFRSFLELGGFGKRPKNDKRKAPSEGQPVFREKGVYTRKNIHSKYKKES
jgi:hypothetical protein